MKLGKLKLFSITIVSIGTFSLSFAETDLNSSVKKLEEQMGQVRVKTAKGTYGAETASARPNVDGFGWSLNADALYWRAKVGGTEFGYTTTNNIDDQVPKFPLVGRTKGIDFKWDWGFRVGLGYSFDSHDFWDINSQYTFFNTNCSSELSGELNDVVVPLSGSKFITDPGSGVVGGGTFKFCKFAKSDYNLKLQIGDLSLGRSCFFSKNLSLRPSVGVRTSRINNEQLVSYTGGSYANTRFIHGLDTNVVKVKDHSDFWGIGLLTGIDSKLRLGGGFSVFGSVSGSLLLGRFKMFHKESYSAIASNYIHMKSNNHRIVPSTQMKAGIGYDNYLNEKKQHIGVSLGFESNYFWKQRQVLTVKEATDVIRYDNLLNEVSTYGLVLNFKWDF